MSRFTEDEIKQKVHEGYILESPDEMTEGYRKALIVQLLVQADTELMSAPAYWMAAQDAPSTNTMVSAVAIIQDELAHANIAYRILEDMGLDKEQLDLRPGAARVQASVRLRPAAGVMGRARHGERLLRSRRHHAAVRRVPQHQYGPLKRALVKVDLEETFHLRHGEVWMKRLANAGGEAKEKLQRAVDWMFPMTIEWFGLPDDMKRHSGQLEYRLKGMTNDELRQTWMSATVPLCESSGSTCPPTSTSTAEVRARLPVPVRVRRGGEALGLRGRRDLLGPGLRAVEGAGPHERAVRRERAPQPRPAEL
jgi:ring-1,2-phenylacetyl-CoA epoxidase subunit PaaA